MSGIIVGVDGSGHSQRALERAMHEAAVHRVPLTVITVSGTRWTAASCMARSRARWEWPEPSTPTIIPDISFSLGRRDSLVPSLPTLGTQDPPDKGRPGWPPGT